jgi:hypothetical protein
MICVKFVESSRSTVNSLQLFSGGTNPVLYCQKLLPFPIEK